MQYLKRWLFAIVAVFTLSTAAYALSMDQAKPGEATAAPMPAQAAPISGDAPLITADTPEERASFEKALHLSDFRRLAIMHLDQVKIIDSWARQSLSRISHSQTLNGQDPVITVLDMIFRRDEYLDKNIIYIQAIPIREGLASMVTDPAEQKRMMQSGLVSYNFLTDPKVGQYLKTQSENAVTNKAVGEIAAAAETFFGLGQTITFCPPDAAHRDQPWHNPTDLWANFPGGPALNGASWWNFTHAIPGYSADQARRIFLAIFQVRDGWASGNASLVNDNMAELAKILPTIDPQGYPSEIKRTVELWYNRTFAGTIIDAFIYFIAMTLFLLVAVGVNPKLERKALFFFGLALAVHITATAIRWWLAGRIPIKNQFESVLGAALIGCVVGFCLESWKKNGIFGMAFSFVGFLAMTACFTFPFVIGKDIGESIGRVAGILDDYWLYIHVNIVIASYALIAATFVIGAAYLLLKQWYWINPIEPALDDASESSDDSLLGSGGGTAVATAPVRKTQASAISAQHVAQRAHLLDVLDGANIVILQMATWFLGIGIICGAVWADHSWGRPWGWDPKETFALVTWLVYLIIIHLRLVTASKADWTAWLSIAGFGVMMFNWIGVNFFLVGLHSYA